MVGISCMKVIIDPWDVTCQVCLDDGSLSTYLAPDDSRSNLFQQWLDLVRASQKNYGATGILFHAGSKLLVYKTEGGEHRLIKRYEFDRTYVIPDFHTLDGGEVSLSEELPSVFDILDGKGRMPKRVTHEAAPYRRMAVDMLV